MSATPLIETSQIDLVIFDCDGVLVDSEPLSNAVMAEHISRLGWPMTGQDAMARFKGSTMAQVHTAIEAHFGQTLDPAWREAFHRDQEKRMRQELKAVPGIRALIKRVHASGLASCVASQGRHEKMTISLGTTGLLDIFKGRIFSAVDVARPKPFPDLFLHAAQSTNVAPARCLVIEDSQTGIDAARAATMQVIGYDPHGTALFTPPGVTIASSMNDIQIV